MTESQLRAQVGLFVVSVNLVLILATIALFFMGGFLFDEMTTTVAILIPMLSVYSTAIIKSIVANRTRLKDGGRPVSKQYVFVSWLFPATFSLYLFVLVILKAFNMGLASFEQFKGMLVASEAIFGTYISILLGSMFRLPKTEGSPH